MKTIYLDIPKIVSIGRKCENCGSDYTRKNFDRFNDRGIKGLGWWSCPKYHYEIPQSFIAEVIIGFDVD